MKPEISIGLPFYNNRRTLLAAVKSVLSQTYQNWELILIDDGSDDGAKHIVEVLINDDPRITLISDGLNLGLIHRLNQIIDLAKGVYIARMDADDMMLPQRLEKQIEAFKANPNVDIVSTAAYTIDENDTPIGVRGTTEITTRTTKDVLTKPFLVHPTILVKTSWYKNNRYDKDFVRAEDYELWCRTFDKTKFYNIKEPLFLYREGNVNVANYISSMITVRNVIRKHGRRVLSKKEMSKEVIKTYLKSYLYQFMGTFNAQYLLSSRRNTGLTESQKTHISQVIQEIKR
jgi:glycosyltransferase involved in cell wall biosynthesis